MRQFDAERNGANQKFTLGAESNGRECLPEDYTNTK